ncbi:MGMT family protein [Synechococcus elongatus]|uniref:MGMT family protein n=1 Tax=Synechococcus elongatus PCC 11801 TaxID=2219813 RepID=A0AAN1UUZ2_SYNEL|nr:MGMT family protein [Synechococcus elongatus]AZB73083.1 methyltransferase [Synechococcus elongatus PCC 11801]
MSTYDQIYAVVRQIPVGCVATYGQVATLAGLAGKPRVVGYALYRVAPSLTDTIPWHRVVNARGEVSMSALRHGSDYLQRHLLEAEGIEFDSQGRLSLHRYRWQPDSAASQSGQCPLGSVSNPDDNS